MKFGEKIKTLRKEQKLSQDAETAVKILLGEEA